MRLTVRTAVERQRATRGRGEKEKKNRLEARVQTRAFLHIERHTKLRARKQSTQHARTRLVARRQACVIHIVEITGTAVRNTRREMKLLLNLIFQAAQVPRGLQHRVLASTSVQQGCGAVHARLGQVHGLSRAQLLQSGGRLGVTAILASGRVHLHTRLVVESAPTTESKSFVIGEARRA